MVKEARVRQLISQEQQQKLEDRKIHVIAEGTQVISLEFYTLRN